MTVRPDLQDGTVDKLNAKSRELMAVDPEQVSVDQRIRVVLDELDKFTDDSVTNEDLNERLSEIRSDVRRVKNDVDKLDNFR